MSASNLRQPLRITSGWTIKLHELLEIDPEVLDERDPRWEQFYEDLLQLEDENRKLILDVGWTPEADPRGSFQLRLIQNREWDHPVSQWRGRSLAMLVEQIEQLALRPPRR